MNCPIFSPILIGWIKLANNPTSDYLQSINKLYYLESKEIGNRHWHLLPNPGHTGIWQHPEEQLLT